ncbi:MAG: membrane protein insertion efficiency factor YidD [Dermatophilaceae bacterium]
MLGQAGRVAALPLIWLIRAYQLVISPLTPPTCRYYPSCSAYALTAIQRFGPLKGTWLAVRRLLRCHPWTPGGVDHVPERPHTGRPQTRPPAPAPQSERPTTTTPKGLS